jgi:hypothetical protein
VPVYPTSGKVTYHDKPLAGALVVFVPVKPDEKVPQPTSRTAEDGTFRLKTYDPDDGAPAGEYRVKISTRFGGDESNPLAKSNPSADPLKGRFEDSHSSGLTAAVKPGQNELPPFELK